MSDIDISSEQDCYRIALLLDYYGQLLTEKQKKAVELYFQEDLSLSEISELSKISRQAVRDSIQSGLHLLQHYDEKLDLIRKFDSYETTISQLQQQIESLKK